MESNSNPQSESPAIVDVIRRSWWIVVILALVFGMLGYAAAKATATGRRATASIVVQDPRSDTVYASLGTHLNEPERYVNDQVAIIGSTEIAEAAASQLRDLGYDTDAATIIEGTTVAARPDSNVIVVTVKASTGDLAIATVNAMLAAYKEAVASLVSTGFSDALAELDAADETNATQIEEYAAQMATMLGENPDLQELRDEYDAAIGRLVELQRSLSRASDETRGAIRDEIDDVTQQIATFRTIASTELQSPELDALQARLDAAIRRESELLTRREQLAVDASLLGTGVVVESRALDTEPTGASAALGILAGLILGGTLGVAIAYWRSSNRRRFEHRLEPEYVLTVPMLAQVPALANGDGPEATLPAVCDPASSAADAYRMLVEALQRTLELPISGSDGPRNGSRRRGAVLAIVSSRSDEGRAAVAVNAAFEAARANHRVLLIDGDVDRQRVSRLLNSAVSHECTVPILKSESLRSEHLSAIREYRLADGTCVDVVDHEPQRGESSLSPDSMAVAATFGGIHDQYDLIIIDEPPLLDETRSGRGLVHADRALIVVGDGSSIADAEDVRYRLSVLGIEPIGYVYRSAPSSRQFAFLRLGPTADHAVGTGA